MLAMAILGFLLAQEFDLDILLKQLEDESPRVRELAAATLVREGRKFEDRLKSKLGSASPELKARLEPVIKDIIRARVLPPVRKVTLEARDERLRDVVDRFDSQVGWQVHGTSEFNDFKVSVRVKDATPLEALDALCRSAGIDFELESGGYFDESKRYVTPPLPVIRLQKASAVRPSQATVGHFRVLVEHVALTRWTRFSHEGAGGTVGLRVQWTPEFYPTQVLLQIKSVVDDRGRTLHEPKSWMKQVYGKSPGQEGPNWSPANWDLLFPESDAKIIGSIKGKGWVHCVTDRKYIEFEDGEKCVGKVVEYDGISARLKDFKREGDMLHVDLEYWGGKRTPTPLIAGGAGIRSLSEVELTSNEGAFPARSGTQREVYQKIGGHSTPVRLFRIEQMDPGRSVKGLRLFVDATVIEDTFEFELKDIPLPK